VLKPTGRRCLFTTIGVLDFDNQARPNAERFECVDDRVYLLLENRALRVVRVGGTDFKLFGPGERLHLRIYLTVHYCSVN
jgi:hypothetical protein